MSEHSQEIPFLWRLSSQDEQGFCAVSMVVPVNGDNDETSVSLDEAHTIPTRVLSFADDLLEADEGEVLEWNEEDLNLFLKLISTRVGDRTTEEGETIRVDLSDPRIIEVVQIVAAAGFGVVVPGEDFLLTPESDLPCTDFELGSHVSISTIAGYKSCIVVESNDDDVICVVLDKIKAAVPGFMEEVNPYELILIKRHQLLHPHYASAAPVTSDVIH